MEITMEKTTISRDMDGEYVHGIPAAKIAIKFGGNSWSVLGLNGGLTIPELGQLRMAINEAINEA